ncbi:MAG TPA: hypothetical protein VNM90_02880 [Haliangium sp.]|nr:hypothetical protein [Haliangium sp.]
MENIDTEEKNRSPVFWMRDRRFIGAMLALGLLAHGTNALARPAPIPKPVEEPEPEESPGTGQDAPQDPEEPPLIEPPEGIACNEEGDDEDCDPGHPADKHPGNKPQPAWYSDMAYRMYELQESLEEMSAWASGEDSYIYYYSTWMKSVAQQYYALGYDDDGEPREYPYGKMTRGDYNYVYYYWVRPIYYSLMYYSAQYYEVHKYEPQIGEYKKRLGYVADSYHPLVLCNYGFNGDDKGSREDLAAKKAEGRAGIR